MPASVVETHMKTCLVAWALGTVLVSATDAATRYTVTDVSNLGGYDTQPARINNLGQMAGTLRRPTDSPSSLGHAFFFDGSTVIDLLPQDFGTYESTVADLNDLSQVLGNAHNPPPNGTPGFPFLFDGTTTRDLTPQI